MKKTLVMITAVGALAFAVPAFGQDAPPATGSTPSASEQCRTERAQMGTVPFALLYGTNANRRNAFGKCVSRRAHATADAGVEAKHNASKDCKAEEQADPAAFAQKYGTGKNKRNAHGKCVSQKAAAKTAETVAGEVAADVDAAKACEQERAADPQAFATKYGKGKTKRNAFRKCVAQTATAG